MTQKEKDEIFNSIIQILEERLRLLVESAFEAKEASTNEESKAENKYDTRGLEASYLASGQARRARELQEQIYLLRKVKIKSFNGNEVVGVSAIVELIGDDEKSRFLFVLPSGGVELSWEGKKIQTITVDSPIGQNIFEQRVGHEFEINSKFYELVSLF